MIAEGTCSACGRANPPGAKFCNECGTPLAQAAGQEVRKTITVLFADLVGFTSLSERLDQESLRRVMDRFYEEMRGAVHAHGGTVAKFIGDAVMAVWGTPVVREDDALRAVRAAEEMRGALAALNVDLEARWGVRVGMRTGVNTGEVVVDPTKPADLLVGDTLNVAARLEQAAADGEILAGSETYRLVRDRATLAPVAEALRLKGKARRLAAYRVVDGSRPPQRRDARLRAPLVGRDGEVARLRAAFDAAVRSGTTRLVTVIGSPGLGKSRLATELATRLAGEARVLRGHCEPVTEGATFLPVAEVLRDATGGGAAEPSDVRASLAAAAPGIEQRATDALAALLGAGAPVPAEETFWAVRRFLETLARATPLAVVLDDVHWGEPTFLDLVEHLEEWGREAPILVVALARPELRETRPALCDEDGREVLTLEPLAPGDSRELVASLLGASDLPPELAERLVDTADGNPLFLGEMLRMLVDDGVLHRDGDAWVTAHAQEVTVPPTIHALLAARLERLPDGERIVAQRAAVIGPQFTRAAVADLAGDLVAADVDAHLDGLRRKDLIVPLEGGDDPSFRFGHALIRDAAYRPLLKESRAELHRRFADWLERHVGEQDEIVGFHLERAYGYRRELGPLDDAGRDLGRRAAERLLEAGRTALVREDLPAATNLLTRALDVLAEEDPARPEALLELGEALLSAGDTARGADVVDELGRRAEATGDGRLAARATVLGGQLANMTGAGGVRGTIDVLGAAAAALAEAGDAAGEAKAHHVIAAAHALLGEVAAAEAALDRALVAARAAGDRRRVTAVLSGAPRAALWGPSPVVRASGRCLDVVRIVRMTPGNRHVEAMALRCQAVLEAMRGRADAGRAILRSGRAALEELGLTLELHELDVYAGTVELLAGDARAAEERLRAAQSGFTALGVDTGAAQAAALLARAALEQDRDAEAIALTEFAEERGGEDLKTAIAWRGVRAEALARRGEHDDAQRLAQEAVALSEPTDALADKADALMSLAAVLRAGGDEAGGRDAAARARELYAAKGHEAGLARTGAPPPARRAAPESDERDLTETGAERLLAEFLRRVNAGDWERLRALYADDFQATDHRTGVAEDIEGPDQMVAALRSLFDLAPGNVWRAARVFAAADTLIAFVLEMTAESVAGGGPVSLGFGNVTTVRDGLVVHADMYAPEDEAAIVARYEELRAAADPVRLAPGISPDHPLVELVRRQCRAFTRADWDDFGRLFADRYVTVDHRNVGWGGLDRARIIETAASAKRISPDMAQVAEILAATEDVVARVQRFRGHAEHTGIAEIVLATLSVYEDGQLVHDEFFDADDRDALLARFDELRAGCSPVRLAPGIDPSAPVVELTRRQCEQPGAAAWEGYAALLADRHGVAADMALTAEVLAADGVVAARILTFRGHAIEGGAPAEVVAGSVCVEGNGRLLHEELFEPHDRDEILARYDDLLVEWARTPPERVQAEFLRAVNRRDWAAVRAVFAPDIEMASRLRMSLWRHETPDELVRELADLTALSPDVRVRARTLASDGEVHAGVQTWSGTHQGAPMEIRGGHVAVIRDGLIVRLEAIEPDDEARLLARFAELRRPDAERVPDRDPGDNLAVAARRRFTAAFEARDWDAMRALHADDTIVEDHRPTGFGAVRGVEDMLALRRNLAEVGCEHWRSRPLAVGAARLALFHDHLSADDPPIVAEALALVQTDGDGRIWRNDAYAVEDEATARRRFERLADVAALTERQFSAVAAGDWAAASATFAADAVLDDHVAGERFRGREAVAAQLRARAGASDAVGGTADRFEEPAPGVFARRETWRGRDRAGRELVVASVFTVDGDGCVARVETFLPGDPRRSEAIARLAAGEPENLAVAARRRLVGAFEARDWEALRALYADDAVAVDHRPLGFGRVEGAGAVVELQRGLAAVGAERGRSRAVAVAGRRIALFEEELSGTAPGGGATGGPVLVLLQTDADGRVWRLDAYPPEERRTARARLDELAAFEEVNDRMVRSFATNDHAQIAAMYAPDVEVDYPAGAVRWRGRDEMVAGIRAVTDPSTRLQGVIDRTDVIDGRVYRRRETWRGDTRRRGEWEVQFDAVFVVDAEGRLLRGEQLLAGDPRVEEAIERLRATGAAPAR